jgi:trehalose 6-phosphate phosphatase
MRASRITLLRVMTPVDATDAAAGDLTGEAAIDAVMSAVADRPLDALVALDYDGTLAPIVSRPEDARPADGAIDALRRIAGLVGTVAIITGRPVRQLLELSGLGELDGIDRLVVRGHYGLEGWNGAQRILVEPALDPRVAEARELLTRLVAICPPGVTVEDKRHSVAIHTRGAADPWAALAAVQPAVDELARESSLELVPGRLVLELRPHGVDKGRTLQQIVAERDPAAVVFIGDDLGDGPAFDVIEDVRAAGTPAAAVFADSPEGSEALRDRADLVVTGPAGVVQFLNGLSERIAGA